MEKNFKMISLCKKVMALCLKVQFFWPTLYFKRGKINVFVEIHVNIAFIFLLCFADAFNNFIVIGQMSTACS